MKDALPRPIANSVRSGEIAMIQALEDQTKMLAETGWTVEEIAWRANYVGPVLEGILHDMEARWHRDQDVEL